MGLPFRDVRGKELAGYLPMPQGLLQALEMHHQTLLRESLEGGAPSINVDSIGMPGAVSPGILLSIISSWNMQPHHHDAVKGV